MRPKSHNFLLAVSSLLLSLFYMTAVFGFDIHSDLENGKVYVGFLAAGISCEHIHPDLPCHHHHADCCEDDEECCSDTIEILKITGTSTASHILSDLQPAVCQLPVTVPAAVLSFGSSVLPTRSTDNYSPPPYSLEELCIFRV